MSKKRFIWQRSLSAGLSVLLCLSMLPVAALAEEPDGSEDAARNTVIEKTDTEIIENTTDNDAVVEDAIVENAVLENDAVESSDDADADAQDIDVQDIDVDAVDVQAVNVQAAAAEHAHPICGRGDACTDPNHASHEIITDWKPIGSESELRNTQANGHYYLTANIIFNRYWRCSNSIVLCLNGHSITFQKASTASDDGISIGSNTNFTICDCSENQTGTITGSTQNGVKVSGGNSIFNMYGGKITGNRNDAGKEDAYGGGVRVTYGSTFNMYGGEISGNQSISDWYSYGGGVYVDYRNSIFNMYGGAITGNTAKTGGGIAVRDNATVTIGGAPIIRDNTGTGTTIPAPDIYITGSCFNTNGLTGDNKYQITVEKMNFTDRRGVCVGTMSKEDSTHFIATKHSELDENDPWIPWYNGEQLFFVRESAKHQGGIHPICGDGAACTAPDHAENHENIAWTPTDHISTYIYGRENRLEPGAYYLTRDTTIDSSRWLVVTGDVKICLNGHTIKYEPWTDGEAGSYCIKLEEGASVSICDCSKGQTGKIIKTTGTDYQNYYSTLFRCLRNSTLNLFGGEISGGGSSEVPTNTAYPGAVKLYGGTFNVYGGKITNCTTNAQSVIDVDSSSTSGFDEGRPNVPGVFNMYGGEISSNRMTPYKGQHNTAAIDATYNNVNIYGGKICNNTAVGNDNVAHGIDVIWSDLTISGGEITGNSGYGVWMTNKTPATALSGGKITGNTKGNFCFAFQRTSDYVSSTAVLGESMASDTNIGISVSPLEADKAPYTLSEACDTDNSRFFHSDMAGYAVIYDEKSKTLQLQKGTALTGTLKINGAAKFGQELTTTLTDTNNSGTLTYKWYRSGENAPIATDTDKCTLTADDIGKTITVVVKSSAELGSVTAVTKVVEKADGPAAPAAFTLGFTLNEDEKTFTATIPEVENAEYSFDGKQYSAVNTKTDCAPNTEYTGYVRIVGNDTQKASAVTSSTQTAPKLTVAAPVFKPDGTISFRGTQTVEISCATPGASIYYTTDGTVPTSNSTAYNGAISLTSTTTIQAIAVKADMNDSAVAAATFIRRSSSGGGGGTSTPGYTVSADKTENGTVTVSPKFASKGDTVTITATPDKGYVLESLTVLDKDGKVLELTDKGGGKYTFVMPAGKVTVKAVFMDDNTMLNFFTDVHAEDYYYDAVLWAAQKGITGGMSDTLFALNAACTRAQIVTFLWRAAGSPEPKALSSFADVPADAYYAKAVAWAVENGITNGTTDTTFGPDETCTRAHGVTFLSRAAKANTASGNSNFADVDVNAYYASAVKWAVDNGITNGISSSLFGPDSSCTRAQIVTFLYRMYQGK